MGAEQVELVKRTTAGVSPQASPTGSGHLERCLIFLRSRLNQHSPAHMPVVMFIPFLHIKTSQTSQDPLDSVLCLWEHRPKPNPP